jgi:hypothetical protein
VLFEEGKSGEGRIPAEGDSGGGGFRGEHNFFSQ